MIRMRTIDQAYAWLVQQDPATAITKSALRRLVTTRKLPSVLVGGKGGKYLVSLEALESYLSGSKGVHMSEDTGEAANV